MAQVCSEAQRHFKPVSHVIFDVDGLLLDTEKIYWQVNVEILEKYGLKFTNEVAKLIRGTTEIDSATILVRETGVPLTVEEYLEAKNQIEVVYLKKAELMPGVVKLVRHLHKSGVPIALATSGCIESHKVKTEQHEELFKLFNHLVSGSSDDAVKHGKPAPDIFLICAERFKDKPSPSKCLVFEDAVNGVLGAVKAGMQVVMVPEKNMVDDTDKEHATLILDSLADFKPETFGLPPYTA